MATKRRCAFCQRDDQKISREHAWPTWIHKWLPPAEERRVRMIRPGKPAADWSAAGDLGLTVNDICKPCNEGWMSSLEQSVEPFLGPMIQRRAPIRFELEQATALTAWAYKTILVFDLIAETRRRHFAAPVRDSFRQTGRPPLSLFAWFAAYRGVHFGRATNGAGPFNLRQNGIERDGRASLITMSIGHVAFQLLVFQPEDLGRSLAGGRFSTPSLEDALIQLWPITTTGSFFAAGLAWPPARDLDDTGLKELRHRFEKFGGRLT